MVTITNELTNTNVCRVSDLLSIDLFLEQVHEISMNDLNLMS